MSPAGRVALAAIAALVAATAACGDGPAESDRPGWTLHQDSRRGYAVSVPPSWNIAAQSLTPGYSDPVEILTAATFPLRAGDELCGERGSVLARVAPAGALVTVQERGRGAYGGSDFPPRPENFRADPELPGTSTWPYCAAGRGKAPVPMLDYWFGFSDSGRAFHVLVAIGKSAPRELRRDAFRILDSLRFDAAVTPDWQSSG